MSLRHPVALVGIGVVGALVGALVLWLVARSLDAEAGFVRRAEVDASPAAVWERVGDPARWPEWSDSVAAASPIGSSGAPLWRLELAGGGTTLLAVAEADAPERLVLQGGGEASAFELDWTIEVEPRAAGATVHWSERTRVRDPWLRLRLSTLSEPAALVEALIADLAASFEADGPADLVVTGAAVWTADPDAPAAEAFAVRDGRFVAVGTPDDVVPFIGPGTRSLALDGARVVPGLIDAHVHLENAARSLGRLDLRPAASRERLLELVAARAATLGPDEWLLARGWSAESWPDPTPPTPSELDAAAGGRPALLTRMDGHSLIASARALALAGITAAGPPDPPGGRIGRGPDGAPDGAVYDEAIGLFDPPAEDAGRVTALTRLAVSQLHAFGVTRVGAIDARPFLEGVLAPLDEAGELRLSVAATLASPGETPAAFAASLDWIDAHRALSPSVGVLGFKGYMDGSLGSHTAWMLEPFADEPGNSGLPLSLAASGALAGRIRAAAGRGLQPAVHAIGDRANRALLDEYAALDTDARAAVRPRVEHAQHLAPEDVARFAALGVVPSMQPYHKADDGRYALERLGAERCATSYAFADLAESGARLAFGSDWPVVSADPWLGVHAAVTAATLDGRTFVPEQSLSVERALVAYTRDAAWALHAEDEAGRIAVGLAADFVVLDRDPFAIPPAELGAVRAALTVVAGEVVHGAE